MTLTRGDGSRSGKCEQELECGSWKSEAEERKGSLACNL